MFKLLKDKELGVVNNFDLLRLIAALQVAITHGANHLGQSNWVLDIIAMFPGVPIFFFLSGFLIYGSYESSLKSEIPLRNFFIKRFLRLYPGLWLCFAIGLLLVFVTGYFSTAEVDSKIAAFWILCQTTVFQFYNPEFMREFGTGVLNGALWTISVEIQFYLLFPILYKVITSRFALLVVFIFGCINIVHSNFNPSDTTLLKLFSVSFMPWIYMFMLGAIIARQQTWIIPILCRPPLLVTLAVFCLICWISLSQELTWGNRINPLGYLAMVWLVIQIAFKNRALSSRLLGKNDISYGVYIYHMPIINALLFVRGEGVYEFFVAISLTVILAIASWRFVERPALRLKRYGLREV